MKWADAAEADIAAAVDKAISTALLLSGSAGCAEEVVLKAIQASSPEEMNVAALVYRTIVISLADMKKPCLACIRREARVEATGMVSIAESGDIRATAQQV